MRRVLHIALTAVFILGAICAGRIPAFSNEPMTPLHVQLQTRDLKTLSMHDRLNMPGSTKVLLGKHAVTLAELRRIHNALVASRNHVKTWRLKHLSLATLPVLTGENHTTSKLYSIRYTGGITFHPTPTPAPGHIYPIRAGTGGYNFPTPTPTPLTTLPFVGANTRYPNDYQQFCGSVPATMCLFYPAGIAWYGQDGNNFWTIDYLVTDQNVCSAEGGFIGYETGWGQLNGDGCIYEYPATQSVQFVPPSAGFTTSGWCNLNMFKEQVDSPHGVVVVADNGAHNQSYETFCFEQVKLNH